MKRSRRPLRFRRDHRWVLPRTSEYLDGELEARGRQRVERHIEECPECREMLRSLETLIQALGTMREDEGRVVAGVVLAEVQRRLTEVSRDDA